MGCWYDTCGVTQLPILNGDKVRLFPLICVAEEIVGGTSYSNAIWAPMSAAISGTYNDYGSIENIVENNCTELFLDNLKNIWIKFERDYETVSDLKDMKLSEALHWIERGYLKVKRSYKNSLVSQMMVLEPIYQSMIKVDPVVSHHNYDTKSYTYKPYSHVIEADIKEWYLNELKISSLVEQLTAEVANLLSNYDNSFLGVQTFNNDALVLYRKELGKLAKQKIDYDDSAVQNLVNAIVEFSLFSRSFCDMRKMWIPQTGKGSQNNELNTYKVVNKTVNKIIRKREKENLELSDEYPDENGYYPYMLEHNAKVESNEK